MAIAFHNGITGPFIGKVGAVVGYVSRGRPIMRGRPNLAASRASLPFFSFSSMRNFP